jgi:hypothetical protein
MIDNRFFGGFNWRDCIQQPSRHYFRRLDRELEHPHSLGIIRRLTFLSVRATDPSTIIAAAESRLMSDDVVSPLARLAGPAAIVAGALLTMSQVVMWTLHRADLVATVNTVTYKITMTAYFIGFFALMVALVALYQRQSLQAGTFGVVALCVAIAGTMDMASNMWFDGFVVPWIADVMPQTLAAPKRGTLVIAALSSYLLLPLGWLLFGIASFRAGVYPRILCVAVMIGGLISFGAGLPPYGIPLGLAVAALGVWCLAHPERRSVATASGAPIRPVRSASA